MSSNVRALRTALGSVAKELSLADFAAVLKARHPHRRKLNATTIKRWEAGDQGEPDIESLRIMAALAGVTFELFTLGDPAKRGGSDRPGDSEDSGDAGGSGSKTGLPRFPRKPVSLVDRSAKKKRKRGKG